MSDLNIFEEARQGGEFFKFKKVGDAVQGTYIDFQRDAKDGFGNMQHIYVLKDKDGKIWNIGFRSTNSVVHDKMATVALGQVVGFRLDELRPSKRDASIMAKIIRVYADPRIVDKEWLARQEGKGVEEGQASPVPSVFAETKVEGSEPLRSSLASSDDVNTESTENAALDAVRNLARTKGIITPDLTVEAADGVIEAFAGLPMKQENLTKIIIALTSAK